MKRGVEGELPGESRVRKGTSPQPSNPATTATLILAPKARRGRGCTQLS